MLFIAQWLVSVDLRKTRLFISQKTTGHHHFQLGIGCGYISIPFPLNYCLIGLLVLFLIFNDVWVLVTTLMSTSHGTTNNKWIPFICREIQYQVVITTTRACGLLLKARKCMEFMYMVSWVPKIS